MEIVIYLIYTILCLLSLGAGFYFGYRTGKENEIPKIEIKTPSQIIEEHKEKKENRIEIQERKKELKQINRDLNNIDNYNGSSDYQEEVE